MKSLFGDNRLANMLHLFQNMQTMSVKSLAAKLDVSDRTIRNDIKVLNGALGDCAVIEGEHGRYTLKVFDERGFRAVVSSMDEADDFLNSPRNRMDYMFGKLMRADAPLLTDDLAYEMSVGRTTLTSDLKRLRQELEGYHLVIQGKTNRGLTLYGNEADIRRYVIEKNFDSIYQDYPLDREVIDIVADYCDRCRLAPDTREFFERYVTLMLDRFLTGHYIGRLSAQAELECEI